MVEFLKGLHSTRSLRTRNLSTRSLRTRSLRTRSLRTLSFRTSLGNFDWFTKSLLVFVYFLQI